jgi:hypothetical protein
LPGTTALAVAGDAMACALETGELLDVEVDEIAWPSAFVEAGYKARRA